MMTTDQFTQTLTLPEPPATLHPVLQALWHDANGHWHEAHEIAQSHEGDPPYDHLHAYLHRKEGDRYNAGYWYRRAGKPVFDGSLSSEWTALVTEFIGDQ